MNANAAGYIVSQEPCTIALLNVDFFYLHCTRIIDGKRWGMKYQAFAPNVDADLSQINHGLYYT